MAVSGNVCMVVCPMLEDELIFGLENDPDKKNIYVVTNGYTETFLEKMNRHDLDYSMLTEYDFEHDMHLNDGEFNIVILMNPMRLHNEPDKLKKRIEEQADQYCGRFDVLVFYYAMCGNFGWDITDWMQKRTETPVLIFRDDTGAVPDDCVGIAVGGRQEYLDLVKKYTGQLFLTPCTATNWGKYNESTDWVGLFDSSDDYMKFLFQMGGYKYALKVDTGLGDRERYDLACEEVAKRMELELHEPESNVATTRLASKLYSEMKDALRSS